MSEVKRKKGESFDAFMRRVKKRWQQSGRILQAKKVQFYSKPKSKNVQRKQTVAWKRNLAKLEYLRKIGRLRDEETTKKY